MRPNELWTCPHVGAARAKAPGCQRSSCVSVRRGREGDQCSQRCSKGGGWGSGYPRSPALRNDTGTITIPQYRFNKTKQHTHTHFSLYTETPWASAHLRSYGTWMPKNSIQMCELCWNDPTRQGQRSRSMYRVPMSNRKTEHHSIPPKGCSRGPKLGTYSDWGLSGIWLLINIHHITTIQICTHWHSRERPSFETYLKEPPSDEPCLRELLSDETYLRGALVLDVTEACVWNASISRLLKIIGLFCRI